MACCLNKNLYCIAIAEDFIISDDQPLSYSELFMGHNKSVEACVCFLFFFEVDKEKVVVSQIPFCNGRLFILVDLAAPTYCLPSLSLTSLTARPFLHLSPSLLNRYSFFSSEGWLTIWKEGCSLPGHTNMPGPEKKTLCTSAFYVSSKASKRRICLALPPWDAQAFLTMR